METIEKRAKAAFDAINSREYKCALAEAQVSEQLYERVKKEYSIAQNAFVQGVIYQRKIDIEKACEAYCKVCDTKECEEFDYEVECCWLKKFRKALE